MFPLPYSARNSENCFHLHTPTYEAKVMQERNAALSPKNLFLPQDRKELSLSENVQKKLNKMAAKVRVVEENAAT